MDDQSDHQQPCADATLTVVDSPVSRMDLWGRDWNMMMDYLLCATPQPTNSWLCEGAEVWVPTSARSSKVHQCLWTSFTSVSHSHRLTKEVTCFIRNAKDRGSVWSWECAELRVTQERWGVQGWLNWKYHKKNDVWFGMWWTESDKRQMMGLWSVLNWKWQETDDGSLECAELKVTQDRWWVFGVCWTESDTRQVMGLWSVLNWKWHKKDDMGLWSVLNWKWHKKDDMGLGKLLKCESNWRRTSTECLIFEMCWTVAVPDSDTRNTRIDCHMRKTWIDCLVFGMCLAVTVTWESREQIVQSFECVEPWQ